MNSFAIVLLGLMIAGQAAPAGKVDTTFDKKANFAALRTYSWAPGKDAFLPEAHKAIISAYDTEMAALGFKKVDSGADVTISYYTLTTTQVDVKALDKMDNRDLSQREATKELGKLVVVMRGAQSREQLWTATANEFLDNDRTKLAATIQTVTARLFATYPTRTNRK